MDNFGFCAAKKRLLMWSSCDKMAVVHDQSQGVKMAEHAQSNLVTTKRGLPVYRANPSIPPSNGLATRHKRFEVPGGKAAVIVDNSTGEIKGLGGVGLGWQEKVHASRFVKLFLHGIKQACCLSKAGMQVFELV